MRPKHTSIPVVAHHQDAHGLPTRVSVPGLTRTVRIVSRGETLGTVSPNGDIEWLLPGSQPSFGLFWLRASVLDDAASTRRRWRAALDERGRVVAVVVPSK